MILFSPLFTASKTHLKRTTCIKAHFINTQEAQKNHKFFFINFEPNYPHATPSESGIVGEIWSPPVFDSPNLDVRATSCDSYGVMGNTPSFRSSCELSNKLHIQNRKSRKTEHWRPNTLSNGEFPNIHVLKDSVRFVLTSALSYRMAWGRLEISW